MTRPFPVYYAMVDGELVSSLTPIAKVQARAKPREQQFARDPTVRTILPPQTSPVQELESQNNDRKHVLFARKPKKRNEDIRTRVERLRKKAFNAHVTSFLYDK